MAQHYLLKSESRTLSLLDIAQMSNEQVFNTFKNIRWKSTNGKPVCPHCGSHAFHYFLSFYKRWKCCECRKQFTLTSGTIFAYHKLPLKVYLLAIVIYSNGAKGHSALQLSRDLNVQYKTAFVLSHKIRESIMNHKPIEKLNGEIEMDVAYFGGYIRPENLKENRIDRRLAENQTGKKRAILTLRQRGSEGAEKTLTFMLKSENQYDIDRITKRFVTSNSVIHTDESDAYDILHATYKMKRVNHTKEYFNKISKACTNNAESFFARMKRSQIGIHHHWDNNYLPYYAVELAYREDLRKKDNGFICFDLLFKALHSPTSDEMCGYWQGNHRMNELLVA